MPLHGEALPPPDLPLDQLSRNESIRLFAERIGVSKADSWIDYGVLDIALRDDLEPRAPRAMAVLDPLKIVLTNYPEGRTETLTAANHPERPELGSRKLPFGREIWIERDDFMEVPPPKFFRLKPGGEVRLKYAYIIKCDEVVKDAAGNPHTCTTTVTVQDNIAPVAKCQPATSPCRSARAKSSARART